jgi:hypothetical protein
VPDELLENYYFLRKVATEGKMRARGTGSIALAKYYDGQLDLLDRLIKEYEARAEPTTNT